MVLLEAQASGLPAVAGRSSGVATIVADGEAGVLPPAGEAAAFAGAVRSLLGDPGRLTGMGAAAESRAERLHDIMVAADLLDAHIRAATASPPR